MTPSQLDHLNRIKTHLETLLANAKKRTPGEWKHNEGRRMLISVDSLHEDAVLYGDEFEVSECDAAFIASCAGNAEAGWRSTLAAIDWAVFMHQNGQVGEGLMETILTTWPLESLKI